jgi:hypothetical protein
MKKNENSTPLDESFTTTLLVTQSPEEVFNAINNVRGWWAESIEGITEQLNAEFLQYYRDIHIVKMKITELIPGKKVNWLVLDNYFSFTKSKTEWNNTNICFDIYSKGDKTQLVFTHQGLVPQYECYDICNSAWSDIINISLHGLITAGKGNPNAKEDEAFNPVHTKRWQLAVG